MLREMHKQLACKFLYINIFLKDLLFRIRRNLATMIRVICGSSRSICSFIFSIASLFFPYMALLYPTTLHVSTVFFFKYKKTRRLVPTRFAGEKNWLMKPMYITQQL